MENIKQPMLRHRKITEERLEKFVSDTYFKDVNIKGKIFPVSAPLTNLSVYHAPGRITVQDAKKAEYTPSKVGDSFGPSWSTHWFKVTADVPSGEEWVGKEIVLRWNGGCEAMVWIDETPIQGLTGGTWVDKRTEYRLTKSAKGGDHFEFMVELACNGMFGTGRDGLINAPDMDKTYTLSQAEIAVFDKEAYDLTLDIVTLWEVAKKCPEDSEISVQALYVANKMVNATNTDDRSTWAQARKIGQQFFSQKNGSRQHNITSIGHCHIDVAWLWPYAETKRKSARSFATQILYMEDYPKYTFTQSQAQLYDWVKQDYPSLFEKMRAKIKSGQFLPTGGTWVEMDGNIPCGEAFIRQFLFGQRFFQKEFGVRCTEFWLPDTFGYSAQLPQVIKHCGIDYFMTQKLSWNNINKFPHTTFLWEGIDGSQVLTHFPPACTYNSSCEIGDIVNTAKDCKDKDRCNESLLVYGHGDGGGGPNVEMLERLKRIEDVDGLPKVQGRSVHDFFLRCEPHRDELLTWVGELYFELHRGTYTSQAGTKKGNRKSEHLLHDAEFLSSVALSAKGLPYSGEINDMWKIVLLNQFHDVLPGSSIGMVYDDASSYYTQVANTLNLLMSRLYLCLFGDAGETVPANIAVINTTGFDREEVVELSSTSLVTPQKNSASVSLGIVRVPPYSFTILPSSSFITPAPHVKVTEDQATGAVVLENQYVRLTIDAEGHITSLFCNKTHRDAISSGLKANKFIIYDDVPLFWDAWDVEVYSLEKAYTTGKAKVKVVENGPLRVSVEVRYENLTKNSSLSQIISLTAVSPRVDFDTTVNWNEAHKFLKVEFPTSIRSPVATYDIQFGHIQRPTHFNTSWDMARFEVCAHKWADLSEHGFGLALLNDCKYGYATHNNIMRLSLLRSPKAPDDQCDMGVHTFRYSLLVHEGSVQRDGVIKHGYEVNTPLRVVPVGANASAPFSGQSIFSVDNPAVVIETIKKAEESDDIIIRVYESYGGTASFTIRSPLLFKGLVVCNGLEEDTKQQVGWADGSSSKLILTPFKVGTYKLIK
eukprot:TRINITY_DN3615_c0_g1_i1.p1 TRINITY_DN3615_c0_g1~~TRINITY_DN3615_c0_g1_i1.p1  ORF type:complete len:1063 (+),score=284.46 TRINITY_DN3615_c0_g1_i1:57-3191(+)